MAAAGSAAARGLKTKGYNKRWMKTKSKAAPKTKAAYTRMAKSGKWKPKKK